MCLFKEEYREAAVKPSIPRREEGKEKTQPGPRGNTKDKMALKGNKEQALLSLLFVYFYLV